MERKNGLEQNERSEILTVFKKAVYAKSASEFDDIYESLLENPSIEDNESAYDYFQNVYDLKDAFALSHRSSLPVRDNQTNNFVEAQFLVLKDIILRRTKEFNIVALSRS